VWHKLTRWAKAHTTPQTHNEETSVSKYAHSSYAALLELCASANRYESRTYGDPKLSKIIGQVVRYQILNNGDACPIKYIIYELDLPRETVRRGLYNLMVMNKIVRKGRRFLVTELDSLEEQVDHLIALVMRFVAKISNAEPRFTGPELPYRRHAALAG
jgi:hypothetical protein